MCIRGLGAQVRDYGQLEGQDLDKCIRAVDIGQQKREWWTKFFQTSSLYISLEGKS